MRISQKAKKLNSNLKNIKKINPKKMRRVISTFREFKINESILNGINEGDGFGTASFLLKKQSDIYNYFFNITSEDEKKIKGYHLIIGKYSNLEVIEGPKNSYCVLTLNEISPELIEDISADKESVPGANTMKFVSEGGTVSRLMEYVSRCLINYLESNSKVTRIYDEIQENLEFKGKGEYVEFMKSIVISYLGEKWSVQQGSSKKSVLISR
jgi:hypothetical protein